MCNIAFGNQESEISDLWSQ